MMNPSRAASTMSLFAAGLLLVSGLAGCGKSTTVTSPDGGRAKVTQKGDQVDVTFQGPKGEKIQFSGSDKGVELPKDFPADAPIYPGAKVVMAMNVGEAQNVQLTTSDDRAKVVAFFKEKMKENGWSSQVTMDTSDGAVLMGKKGNRSLSVSVNTDGKGTAITVMVSQEK